MPRAAMFKTRCARDWCLRRRPPAQRVLMAKCIGRFGATRIRSALIWLQSFEIRGFQKFWIKTPHWILTNPFKPLICQSASISESISESWITPKIEIHKSIVRVNSFNANAFERLASLSRGLPLELASNCWTSWKRRACKLDSEFRLDY